MNTDKHCHTCKQPKPRTAFAISRAAFDGLQPECRACNKIRRDFVPRGPRAKKPAPGTLAPADVQAAENQAERVEQRRALKAAIRIWLNPLFKGNAS